MQTFLGYWSLKSGCRAIAIIFGSWAILNLIFNLSAFTSPNYHILVDYHFLDPSTKPIARTLYTTSNVIYWLTHLMSCSLLLVGVQMDKKRLLNPFLDWIPIGIGWEIVFVIQQIINARDWIQGAVIGQTLIMDVGIPIYFFLIVRQYQREMALVSRLNALRD